MCGEEFDSAEEVVVHAINEGCLFEVDEEFEFDNEWDD
jgi:hypothetical protein